MAWGEPRSAIVAALDGVRDLASGLPQAPTDELTGLLAELAELVAVGESALVAVTAEAEVRGVVDQSQCASTRAWVAETGWFVRDRSGSVAKAAEVIRQPVFAPVAEALRRAELSPAVAVTVAREHERLRSDLRPETLPAVLDLLLQAGVHHGHGQVRRLREEILATFGQQDEFQDRHDRCSHLIELSSGTECNGAWHFDLTLDTEGRAVLEAAIGPGSAPQLGPDGERDTRVAPQRRGQALMDVLSRSASASATDMVSSGGVKTTVLVTMTLDGLRDRVGAATVLGSRAGGDLLPPETVRKLACDARVIPVVLGGSGEILDEGRAQRLFTPAQLRALWLRDRHCSFPGCTSPAHWCDAHHLIHWCDGGLTDLGNGALLCPRHHTVVHRDRLAGTINSDGGVEWDRTPGSYRALAPPGRGAPGAPGITAPINARG